MTHRATEVPASLAGYVERWQAGADRRGLRPREAIAAAMAAFAPLPRCLRCASASEWSMYYLAALIVPTVALAACDRLPRVAIDDLDCALDEAGRVTAFHPTHEDHGRAADRFASLIGEHLDPALATIRDLSGVSPRVLWSNAAVILDWVVGELRPGAAGCEALAEAEAILRGHGDPRLARPYGDSRQRRVCCLRYHLPNGGLCPGICPRATGVGT